MIRRSLYIILIAVVVLLSIGEAYHYHPDGGERWHFASFPFASRSSVPDSSTSDGKATANSPTACPLHFWSSLLSTISILLPSLLLPPAIETNLYERTPHSIPSWTEISLPIRAPPTILS
ncbi:MAG: hypothetical protein ACE5I9_04720 [Candidatus Methylomirabilales bacterium]